MNNKELINELAKYACNSCCKGLNFDGECYDLVGDYKTCSICQETANKIYEDFICKYVHSYENRKN